MNTQRTPFYTFGPAQTTGADFALYHGQRLTMLSYEYGFSHVAIEGTGETGYVPTEDIAPAPPLPRPSPSAFPSPSAALRQRGVDGRRPTAAEQSRVPLPEFPETEPAPGSPTFRY